MSITDNAIEKINTEMQKDPTNTYIEIIGHYIIDRCTSESVAGLVMDEGKSLNSAWEAVQSAAKKIQKGGCTVLKDSEVFDIIDEHFGFNGDNNARAESVRQVDGATIPQEKEVKKQKEPFINLDFDNLFS